MYSKNVTAYLLHLMEEFPDEGDPEDDIVKGTLLVRGGRVVNERVLERHPELRSPAEPEPVPQAETGAIDA